MKTIYIYVLDTLADWELGYITAELHSKRFFKKGAPLCEIKIVSSTKESITTMGGILITPDYGVKDILINQESVLLLPGADSWGYPKHAAILEKASGILAAGGTVAAICGATLALANYSLLDNRYHTSNGAGFLDMMSANYHGGEFYVEAQSVVDGNLITASTTGGLLWSKQIIESLAVFHEKTLDAWYDYFETGEAEHYFALANSMQDEREE